MSNYRSLYADPSFAPSPRFTPKQRRRFQKKTNRDLILGAAQNTGAIRPGNSTKPAPLSGHPGRRRAQLAEERVIARALRRQAAASKSPANFIRGVISLIDRRPSKNVRSA